MHVKLKAANAKDKLVYTYLANDNQQYKPLRMEKSTTFSKLMAQFNLLQQWQNFTWRRNVDIMVVVCTFYGNTDF